jgi:sugar/nucleoside kinase (ribokinase family)
VEEKLASGPVDLSGLRKLANQKTGVTIWYARENRRAGLTYPGTIAMLESTDIPTGLLMAARHLHVGAYFLQRRLHSDAPRLFAAAKTLGLTTSLDCNYDPSEQWDSNLRDVLVHTDVFLPNEDEALAITGAPDVVSAARQLASIARVVVVKRGAAGAFTAAGTEEFALPALPTTVVDTTGAGDSFNAGFLVEFVKGSQLDTCVRSGMRAAARNVQHMGGTAAFEA